MARNNSIVLLFAQICFVVAFCIALFTRGVVFWFMLFVVVLIAVYICVETLTRGIPVILLERSRENCFRLDGSRSDRRARLETKSVNKIRSDLWAISVIVSIIGAAGLLALHSIFPLKLVPDVVSAAWSTSEDFKTALRERGVARKFADWADKESSGRMEDTQERQQWLWMTWPIILCSMVIALFGCLSLVRFAYLQSLREFERGIATRSEQYLNLDIGRLQG